MSVATDAPNIGSFVWTVPTGLAVGGNYTVKIRANDDKTCKDFSDAAFSVAKAPCTLQLTSPNGGEAVERGSQIAITWSGTLPGGTVKLVLFKAGTKHSVIAADVPNTGSYAWNVPGKLPIASNYKIRVLATADNTCRDFSDAAFSIVKAPCTLTLTGPNGGEEIPRGTQVNITWSGTLPGTTVKLVLFRKGVKHSLIAPDVPDTGNYAWNVPAGLPLGGKYKIKVQAIADKTCRDLSDTGFKIIAGP